MPGTITFKPIEANLTHNTDFIKKMNPYCAFIVGGKRINSQISKYGGNHPHWSDAVTVPYTNESKIDVELMDKDRIMKDDLVGSFSIDLPELQAQGQSSRWYSLYCKNRPAGEILLEASIHDDGFGNIAQPEYIYKEEKILTTPVVTRKKPEEGVKTYVEQRQPVEPHTFMKEVDVVETRPVQQTIQVLEPRKVMKEVQYTDIIPVKKQIETIEPHIVTKEVEVMEPRLVTKMIQVVENVPVKKQIETVGPQVVTKEVEVMEPRLVTKMIQVVENVPVKKQVEVIESVPRIQEFETFEPRTFTKQVEITEQVPVMKTVTVTEPVHLKKAVEFVEPIITTQTITKEIRPEAVERREEEEEGHPKDPRT